MEIKIFKDEEIQRLEDDIDVNIQRGRYGAIGFESYIDPSKVVPLKNTNFNENLFSQLELDKKGAKDATNAKIIYESLEGLTPYLARDNRVWTYLSHTTGLKFSLRDTYDIEDKDARIKKIKNQFFIKGNDVRVYSSRHILSRLWWAAHLCIKHSDLPFDKALEVFCTSSDFRASVIERTNTYPEPQIFRAMLNVAHKRWNGTLDSSPFFRRIKNESPYRDWHKLVNRNGGAKLLSFMGEQELINLLEATAVQGERAFKARHNLSG